MNITVPSSHIHIPCTLFFRFIFEQRWRCRNLNALQAVPVICKHSWSGLHKHLYMHITLLVWVVLM